MYYFGIGAIINTLLINWYQELARASYNTNNFHSKAQNSATGASAPITYTSSHLRKPGFSFVDYENNRRNGGGSQNSGAGAMSSEYFSSFNKSRDLSNKKIQAKTIEDFQPVLQDMLRRMDSSDSNEVVEIINSDNSLSAQDSKLQQVREAELRTKKFAEQNIENGTQLVQAKVVQQKWVDRIARNKLEELSKTAAGRMGSWVARVTMRPEELHLGLSAAAA